MIDLWIVLAFVAYSVGSGFYNRAAASRSVEEFFLAGRTIKGWQSGFSMAATQFAADTPLLVAGLIATGGLSQLWRLWIYGLGFLVMSFVFAGSWRRARVLTDAELTELRYGGRGALALRVLKAVYYGTVINCVVMAMVLVGAVRIAEVFLPWHEWLPDGVYSAILSFVRWIGLYLGESVTGLSPEMTAANNLLSILATVSFTTLYSTTGGLRSVIATDVVQLSLAMVASAVYAWVVVGRAGGPGGLGEQVAAAYGSGRADALLGFAPIDGAAWLPFLTIVGLQWLFQMNSDGTGYLAQRLMACADQREARLSGIVFAWVQIFARSLIWLVIGVGLLILYPIGPGEEGSPGFAASRELAFVTGIDDLLPPGVRGLMLTGMLAALASTVDTHLNWGASYWCHDVYDRLLCQRLWRRTPGSRELVFVGRLSNLLVLGISLVLMTGLGAIQTAWFISLLFGAGTGSVLVLRWLWERINLGAEIAAIVASLVVAPVLLFWTDSEAVRLAVMAAVSTTATIAAAWLGPPTDEATRVRFYRRVRPPGFWTRTARAAGEDPASSLRALAAGLRAATLCAASLFLLLVGCGKLLITVASPLAPLAMVAAGLALVPLWWRDAMVRESCPPTTS